MKIKPEKFGAARGAVAPFAHAMLTAGEEGKSVTFSPDKAEELALALDAYGKAVDAEWDRFKSERGIRKRIFDLYLPALALLLGWLIGHYG